MSSCAPANSRIIDASRWLSSVCCHVMSDGLPEAGFVFEQPIGAQLEEDGLGPSRQIFTGYRRSNTCTLALCDGTVALTGPRRARGRRGGKGSTATTRAGSTRSPHCKGRAQISPRVNCVCPRVVRESRRRKKTCVAMAFWPHSLGDTTRRALKHLALAVVDKQIHTRRPDVDTCVYSSLLLPLRWPRGLAWAAAQPLRLRGGVPGLPLPQRCPLESIGLSTWKEHIRFSSTDIIAPQLSNSPQ